MPIPLKCQCGKALQIPDAMAGKAIKCPGCAAVVRVPGGAAATGSAAQKPAAQKPAAQKPAAQKPATPKPATPRPAAQRPAPSMTDSGRMNELFDEEGFSAQVAAVCPACRVEMPAGSVLCTKCGYNKQTGMRLDGHKTAGVDIDHGTLALMKAKADMEKTKKLDDAVLAGAGMPWWMLALVLFMLISGLSIAVLAVNASRRLDESLSFNPMATFMILAGSAFCAFSIGSFLMIAKHAIATDIKKAALCVLPPYALYYVFKNPRATWKPLVTSIILARSGSV